MAFRLARTVLILMWLFSPTRNGQAAMPGPADLCPEMTKMPYQVRPSTCRIAKAVDAGTRRSQTFRRLVLRIGELQGIVYVDARFFVQPGTKRVLSGTLQHRVVMAGEHRLLFVTVAPESGDEPTVTLAHELQHAIEVLEAHATTDAAVEAVFERIGMHTSAGIFETNAATDSQRAVARELSASPAATKSNRD